MPTQDELTIECGRLVGRERWLKPRGNKRFSKLTHRVRIMRAVVAYGEIRCLVSPCDGYGYGEQWVAMRSLLPIMLDGEERAEEGFSPTEYGHGLSPFVEGDLGESGEEVE